MAVAHAGRSYSDGYFDGVPAKVKAQISAAAQKSQRQYVGRSGMYAYIPLSSESFKLLVKPLLKPGMRVVDVGCGAGDKLFAFHKLDKTLHITGIEYSSVLARKAKKFCHKFATIVHGDARKQDYSKYDLIYMYRPMASNKGQAAIQHRVMKTMKIGAVLAIRFAETVNVKHGHYFPDLNAGPWTKEKPYNPTDYPVIPKDHLEYYKKER